MCRKTVCGFCAKYTWAGCGEHIDMVLKGIDAHLRCPGWQGGKCCLLDPATTVLYSKTTQQRSIIKLPSRDDAPTTKHFFVGEDGEVHAFCGAKKGHCGEDGEFRCSRSQTPFVPRNKHPAALPPTSPNKKEAVQQQQQQQDRKLKSLLGEDGEFHFTTQDKGHWGEDGEFYAAPTNKYTKAGKRKALPRQGSKLKCLLGEDGEFHFTTQQEEQDNGQWGEDGEFYGAPTNTSRTPMRTQMYARQQPVLPPTLPSKAVVQQHQDAKLKCFRLLGEDGELHFITLQDKGYWGEDGEFYAIPNTSAVRATSTTPTQQPFRQQQRNKAQPLVPVSACEA